MATAFTVTANSSAIEFKDFGDAGPRYYIDDIQSGPMYENLRFRAPGWNGNALIRGGFTGEQLALIVRYQDTLVNAIAAWRADKNLFAQYNCTLNDGVTTWTRATMRSSERITDEFGRGASAIKFFEVRYVFDVEEQY